MIKNINKIAITLTLLSSSIFAIDIENRLSGFLTLGGSITDKPYTYNKYISNDGTLRSDTKGGLQLTTLFGNKLSTTFQGVIAQSESNDTNYKATLNWGYLSYRPTNDWLINAGKIRIPLYLLSQNKDVGVTYDFTTLPREVYSPGAYDNGLGAMVTKSFELDEGTLYVDTFFVNLDIESRVFITKPIFVDYNLDVYGSSISYLSDDENKYRIGIYRATEDEKLDATIDFITLGVQYNFENEIKLLTEFTAQKNKIGNSTTKEQSFYITTFKPYEKWTNYLGYGISLPSKSENKSYTLGTSYTINPLQKVKFEYKHITTGVDTNSLIDNDINYSNENINQFTLTYNYAF